LNRFIRGSKLEVYFLRFCRRLIAWETGIDATASFNEFKRRNVGPEIPGEISILAELVIVVVLTGVKLTALGVLPLGEAVVDIRLIDATTASCNVLDLFPLVEFVTGTFSTTRSDIFISCISDSKICTIFS
jgi:hypothetical protein